MAANSPQWFWRPRKENLSLKKWKWKSCRCVQLFVTLWTIQSMEISRPEYWSGLSCPPPGDLPNPGIKSRSSTLQVDSLPALPLGKPKNTGVSSLSLLQWIFQTQESNWGLLHSRQVLYQLSYQGSQIFHFFSFYLQLSNGTICHVLKFSLILNFKCFHSLVGNFKMGLDF